MKECLLDKSIQVTYTCTLLHSNIDWNVEQNPLLFKLAWENSRHFASSPRNNVGEASAEMLYWWRITTQIRMENSSLVFYTSFCGETCHWWRREMLAVFKAIFKLASPDRNIFFRLRLYERGGISLADKYKRIIFDLLKDLKGLTAETIKLLQKGIRRWKVCLHKYWVEPLNKEKHLLEHFKLSRDLRQGHSN